MLENQMSEPGVFTPACTVAQGGPCKREFLEPTCPFLIGGPWAASLSSCEVACRVLFPSSPPSTPPHPGAGSATWVGSSVLTES